MIGVIDVGGGLRGIYGSGVFDRCLDDNVAFDYCIGVSAGSANAITYLSGQKGRTYRFYHDYSSRKEYMSFGNFLKHSQYIDLDYVYGTLTNSGGEDELDFPTAMKNKSNLTVVVTDAKTGKPAYFTKHDMMQDDYRVLKASSALPLVCKSYEINGRMYYDGGISDPVPVKRALEDGCEKFVLILTKPLANSDTLTRDGRAAKLLKGKYPELSEKLKDKSINYKKGVDLALELEKQGKCIIIAPDDCCGVSTLTKEKDKLHALYEKGYNDGARIKEFVK
ncbi:MAG: patatin family protein [Clostridia bacterium]|nr:patatin family protein [Clostridia bacterium]